MHDEPLYDVAGPERLMALLDVTGLRKEFGGLVAVDDVDFAIEEGAIVEPDRPERRRQDDVLQHAHRRLQADGRPDRLRRRRT